MEYTVIKVSVENRVATVLINRPEVMNAFAPESYTEIADAMYELGKRKDVGAIVITGAGKHFSAGGDIKRFKYLIDTEQYLNAPAIANAGNMSYAIRTCPKPVIAMINGVATGAGLSCALAADFRVVQPSSKMIMGFINLGLPCDTGACYHLMRLIGPEKTELMMMTGEPVRGEDCYKLGLASTIAEEGKLEEAAYALAAKLASKSASGHALQKSIINRYFYQDLPSFFRDEGIGIETASRTPDFSEAVNAFLEKRAPEFNR